MSGMWTYGKFDKGDISIQWEKKNDGLRNGVDLTGSPSGEKTKVDTTSYLLLLYTVINLRWVWFKDLTVSEQRNM